MENQENIYNQNFSQEGQNTLNKASQFTEKPKTNYLIIGLVVLIFSVSFGLGGYYLGKQSVKPEKTLVTNDTSVVPTILPTVTPEKLNFDQLAASESTSLINSSGKDMDYQTNPPLGIKLVVPKDARYKVISESTDKDWGINLELTSGIAINFCTGCQIAKCGDLTFDDCSGTKISISNTQFDYFTYKSDPSKLALILGTLKNRADIVVTIRTSDNRLLTDTDMRSITQLLESVK